ncbi:hypothetical protein OPV22_015496 [Ensete ventricosum]|uniref:Uncharacterized protein n=1 Tax=Ensete ventricosum TaxID=4639 RepID=A0AAV8RA20_ENSVE|nr:hypothetical protein OPV22_015496 [Ensete ventricosum]
MAGESRKERLDQPLNPSFPESLLVDGKPTARGTLGRKAAAAATNGDSIVKPVMATVPRSQVLGKVKDFLGVIAEANEKLEVDVRGSSRADYNVEVLTGNEEKYIEMDLLLGVTDLHTAEAVEAAEAAMSGFRPSAPFISSSSSDSDDNSDDDAKKLKYGLELAKLCSEDGSWCMSGLKNYSWGLFYFIMQLLDARLSRKAIHLELGCILFRRSSLDPNIPSEDIENKSESGLFVCTAVDDRGRPAGLG